MRTVPAVLLRASRRLRKNQTPWEARLWRHLRANIMKAKFKRQVRLGNYIVDFYCASRRLIIELDGSHHNQNLTKLKDRSREEFLETEGFKVLRFWNNEVNENLEGVLEVIKRELRKPLPNPPLARGGS